MAVFSAVLGYLSMSDLHLYYRRLYELIAGDVEVLLSEPDMTKRSPKIILEYLKMASQCQLSMQELDKSDTKNDLWTQLSPAARIKIESIIKTDLENSQGVK